MFSKNKKAKGPAKAASKPQPAKPAVPSIISSDMVMTGDLNSEGEIQVDGKVIGDIRARTLLIGKTAEIVGEVNAEDVRVHGNVNGQIKAQSVTLAKTAHVIGDILHEDLSIETGAFLEGLCRRMTDSELPDKGDGGSEKGLSSSPIV